MSWEASGWAKKCRVGGPATKSLLLCLADYADDNHQCYPGQERLAWETEQSVRTVRRQLDHLVEIKAISRERRFRPDGSRTSDCYTLQVGAEIGDMTYPAPPFEAGEQKTTGQSDRRSGMTGGQSDRRSDDPPTTGQPTQETTGQLWPVNYQGITSNPRTTSGGGAHSAPTPEQPALDGTDSPAADGASTTDTIGDSQPEPEVETGRRKRKTRLPDDFTVTDGMRAWAARELPQHIDVDAETAHFRDHHAAHGSVMADWSRAWMTWMRKARQFGPRNNVRPIANRHHAPGDAEETARQMFGGKW